MEMLYVIQYCHSDFAGGNDFVVMQFRMRFGPFLLAMSGSRLLK